MAQQLKPLPILSDYDISPITGFLPVEEPLQVLPDPYFAPWEETFQKFNGLLLASRLRQYVNEVSHTHSYIPFQRPFLPHFFFICLARSPTALNDRHTFIF
jgi:indoleamine 2,3-dioxygenase